MNNEELTMHEVKPSARHNSTFILLHERGSSGVGFCQALCQALGSCAVSHILPGTRFVFPDGPLPAAEGGRDWYALEYPGEERKATASPAQWRHVAYAAEQLDMVIADEASVIGRENVFIGGVGTGCAVAMFALMEMELPLGGFLGFGGWMPFVGDVKCVATTGELVDPQDRPGTSEGMHRGIAPSPLRNQISAQDDGWHPEMGQSTGPGAKNDMAIDPSLFNQKDEELFHRPIDSLPAPRPSLEKASDAMRHRVVDFLRSFEWEARDAWAAASGVDTPVLLLHGRGDQTVSFDHGKEAQEMLQKLGFQVKLKILDAGHDVSSDVLGVFLTAMLDNKVGGWPLRDGILTFFQGGLGQ